MKWVAHFNNNTSIKQFDENGNEILYQKVIDNIGNLKHFCLYNNIGDMYMFDLVTNIFYHNEDVLLNCGIVKYDSKFIYYRKCFLTIGEKDPYVIQCVGFETDNGKCILEINQQTKTHKFVF